MGAKALSALPSNEPCTTSRFFFSINVGQPGRNAIAPGAQTNERFSSLCTPGPEVSHSLYLVAERGAQGSFQRPENSSDTGVLMAGPQAGTGRTRPGEKEESEGRGNMGMATTLGTGEKPKGHFFQRPLLTNGGWFGWLAHS